MKVKVLTFILLCFTLICLLNTSSLANNEYIVEVPEEVVHAASNNPNYPLSSYHMFINGSSNGDYHIIYFEKPSTDFKVTFSKFFGIYTQLTFSESITIYDYFYSDLNTLDGTYTLSSIDILR